MRTKFQFPVYRSYANDWGDEKLLCLRWPVRLVRKYKKPSSGVYNSTDILAGERIYDISPALLELDTSAFSTMLSQISAKREGLFFRDSPEEWGFAWDDDTLSEQAKRAHDYFLDQQASPKIEWLEDDLMPRLSAKQAHYNRSLSNLIPWTSA